MSRSALWGAVVDCGLFLVAWGWNAIRAGSHQHALVTLEWLYWLTGVVGLGMCIHGFVVIVRSRLATISRPVITILFAMIPGCAALIGLLSHIFRNPV